MFMNEQLTNSAKICNYLPTYGGGRAHSRAAHSDVPISILQQTAIKHDRGHITTNAAGHTDTPPIQPDVRAAQQGARLLPASQDRANSKSSQDTLQNVSWRFCTMNMRRRVSLKLETLGPTKS